MSKKEHSNIDNENLQKQLIEYPEIQYRKRDMLNGNYYIKNIYKKLLSDKKSNIQSVWSCSEDR